MFLSFGTTSYFSFGLTPHLLSPYPRGHTIRESVRELAQTRAHFSERPLFCQRYSKGSDERARTPDFYFLPLPASSSLTVDAIGGCQIRDASSRRFSRATNQAAFTADCHHAPSSHDHRRSPLLDN